MIHSHRAFGALAAAVAMLTLPIACRDAPPSLTAPRVSTPTLRPATLASSAVSTPTLAWIAPLGSGTADPVTFDAAATPVVEICAWSGSACTGALVARFTTAPIGAERPLTANPLAGRFEASWSLLEATFTTRRTYRIRVLQGETELSALSVDVVRGRWALNRVDGTLAPLASATTLPIHFHVGAAGCPAPSITPASIVTTVAGTGVAGFSGDGMPATNAQLNNVGSVAFGPDGSLYISDTRMVRRVNAAGIITTVAGTGMFGYSGDGGPALAATFYWPHADAIGPDGTIYIADYANCRVRVVAPNGIVTTIAGTGTGPFFGGVANGDGGPAVRATVCAARIARAADGSLYLGTYGDNNVRRIGPDGVITTVAGTGVPGSTGDGGLATSATLNGPAGVVLGPDGALYIGEGSGNRIRRVDPNGVITTIAGTGVAGDTGDGGPATAAQVNFLYALAFGPDRALYFASGTWIRRIGCDGIISTVAGTKAAGYGGDGGPAGQASFWIIESLAFAPDGALLVADSYNSRVRRIK